MGTTAHQRPTENKVSTTMRPVSSKDSAEKAVPEPRVRYHYGYVEPTEVQEWERIAEHLHKAQPHFSLLMLGRLLFGMIWKHEQSKTIQL
jgi:hypothetical protein